MTVAVTKRYRYQRSGPAAEIRQDGARPRTWRARRNLSARVSMIFVRVRIFSGRPRSAGHVGQPRLGTSPSKKVALPTALPYLFAATRLPHGHVCLAPGHLTRALGVPTTGLVGGGRAMLSGVGGIGSSWSLCTSRPKACSSCPSPSRQLGRVTPFGSTKEWSLRLVPPQVWRRLRRWGGGGLKGEIPRGQRFAGSPRCLGRQQPRHLARTPRAHYLNHSAQFPPRLGLEPVAPGLRPSSWLASRRQRLSPFCVGRSQS